MKTRTFIKIAVYLLMSIAGISLMTYVKGVWSGYGDYTTFSFLVSIMIHFCPCMIVAWAISKAIDQLFK